MAEDYSSMTVNERLCVAGLMSAYEAAVEGGDLKAIIHVLAQVGLRQDSDGMNWEVANDA